MALRMVQTGNRTEVIHTSSALPHCVGVISKIDALEALDVIQYLQNSKKTSVLRNSQVMTGHQACETLRKFILTR